MTTQINLTKHPVTDLTTVITDITSMVMRIRLDTIKRMYGNELPQIAEVFMGMSKPTEPERRRFWHRARNIPVIMTTQHLIQPLVLGSTKHQPNLAVSITSRGLLQRMDTETFWREVNLQLITEYRPERLMEIHVELTDACIKRHLRLPKH